VVDGAFYEACEREESRGEILIGSAAASLHARTGDHRNKNVEYLVQAAEMLFFC
jgi:hypothetical protein